MSTCSRPVVAARRPASWNELQQEDVNKLQVTVDDCYGESHPGSFHLNQLGDEAVLGVHESGGRAVRHHVTDICDGWGQGHDGMNYIGISRSYCQHGRNSCLSGAL